MTVKEILARLETLRQTREPIPEDLRDSVQTFLHELEDKLLMASTEAKGLWPELGRTLAAISVVVNVGFAIYKAILRKKIRKIEAAIAAVESAQTLPTNLTGLSQKTRALQSQNVSPADPAKIRLQKIRARLLEKCR